MADRTCSLLCYVEGDPLDSFSEIEIDCRKIISRLKLKILEAKQDAFAGLDANQLIIWKLRHPIRNDEKVVENLKDALQNLHRVAIKPRQSATISETFSPDVQILQIIVQRPAETISPSRSNIPAGKGATHGMGLIRPFHPDPTFWVTDRILRPGEKTRADEIIYRLYDALWRNEDGWKVIMTSVQEVVPFCNEAEELFVHPEELFDHSDDEDQKNTDDETQSIDNKLQIAEPQIGDNELQDSDTFSDTKMKEREEQSTALFIDVRALINWTKADEQERLLCPYFLLRDEYIELDKYLSDLSNVLLLGQSGIGKTVYLTYCLLKRLIEGLPTIFSTSPINRYLFQESGVYWIPMNSFFITQNPDLKERDPDSLALLDLNDSQLRPEAFRHFKLLVATSPGPDRYKKWSNQIPINRFVMRTWTWPEVYHARDLSTVERDPAKLWRKFMKYGGCARNLFERTQEEVKVLISTAIANCSDIGKLFPFDYAVRDDTSLALVKINPPVKKDGSLNRTVFRGHIATQYILHQILERRRMNLANSMEATFRTLFNQNVTRSASSILFEGAGHRYIFHLLSQPLSIYPLPLDGSDPIEVNFSHVTKVYFFDPDKIGQFNNHKTSYYYRPLSSSLPGIDSFIIERDDMNVPTCVTSFQFTTASQHSISPKFLEQLWITHKRASDMVKWKLIFVVPDGIKTGFGVQSWTPAPVHQKWASRVDQFVVGVDTSKLWNHMRLGI